MNHALRNGLLLLATALLAACATPPATLTLEGRLQADKPIVLPAPGLLVVELRDENTDRVLAEQR